MATFTMPLKSVLDITKDIGLDEYPIFDESHRAVLNKKIIDHYWNQEIGQEEISMFVFAMRRKMNEIMPTYNALYKAQATDLNPLLTFQTRSDGSSQSTQQQSSQSAGSTAQESSQEQAGRATSSQFPSQMLSENGDYAESATDNNGRGSANAKANEDSRTSGNSAATGTMSNVAEGFQGRSVTDMIAEIRDNFTNIDLDIINELGGLFMQVWDNGDSYTPQSNVAGYFGYFGGWAW